jgi:DNA-directed RNA polymerase sigma subunit (sigma70/sigma32)
MKDTKYSELILKFDGRTTGTVYNDEEVSEILESIESVEDNDYTKTKYSTNYHRFRPLHDELVFTRKGELKAFKRYDVLKKLLNNVKTRLKSNVDAIPTQDDISLYLTALKQQEHLCRHNTRLVFIAMKYYLKNRIVGSNEMLYESDANYALFLSVCKFDYTKGYKLSTYFMTVAFNHFKITDRTIRKHSRSLPVGLKPMRVSNKRLYSENGTTCQGLDMVVSTEPNPSTDTCMNENSECIAEALKGLTKTEQTIITDFYLKNTDLRNAHGVIRDKLNLNKNAYKVSLRSGLKKLKKYNVLEHLI